MSTTTTAQTSEIAIFGRLFEPAEQVLTPEAAQALLAIEFSRADRDRMHHLALRAQTGTLTSAEQVEIENYEKVGHLLAILHVKARLVLKGKGRRAGRNGR